MSDWPVDEDGQPMAQVTAGAGEKIGLPQFSNVDIGPISVTRFVKDTPDSIKEGLKDCISAAEELIATERASVLEMVQGKATEKSGGGYGG